ncbi:anthranilate phosphoribosyltransferase [bacterium]|nr:MAG: anthranilate phosphoribosyltransferase [bacterium]
MTFTEILHKLVEKQDLSAKEAGFALNQIIEGAVTDIEAGTFLFGMRMKGETIEELTALVQTMRNAAVKVQVDTTGAIDLCGTGGDHSGYFNISTAAMFVVAGAGIPVLKHGNRSVSSQTGSADVLEALGVKVDLQAPQVEKVFEKTGMGFMFAPLFHPAMKNIVPVRKAMKMRTLFNMLGPLLNPADVKRQLIGAFSEEAAFTMIQILAQLETEKAITVHAHQGLDELSVLSESSFYVLQNQRISEKDVFHPKDVGMIYTNDSFLKGGDKHTNANLILSVLKGEDKGIREDVVVLNAAYSMLASRDDLQLEETLHMARESIRSGKAYKALTRFAEETQKA